MAALYPLMFAGLLGLSLPIIIHLIQRQRLKPQMLATLRFLDKEDVANAFAPKPRDTLQLILRLILLSLFVLLMCRLLTGAGSLGPRTLAVVLDQSLSMQQKVGPTTLFDRSVEQIGQLIDTLRPEDKLALIVVGDRVTLDTGYLSDPAALKKRLAAVKVSDSGGLALMPAIRSAGNELRGRREVNPAVLVFSDHQQLNYTPYLAEAAGERADAPTQQFRGHLADSRVKLLLIDPLLETGVNVAIEEARLDPPRVYVGAASRVTAVVHNRSDKPQTAKLSVFAKKAVKPEKDENNPAAASAPPGELQLIDDPGNIRTVDLAPGETAQVDVVHQFADPEDTALRVEIDDDALPGDNRYHVAMRMKDRRQILLVAAADEEDEEEAGQAELRYRGVDLLAYALNPGEALGQGSGTYVSVKRVTPQALPRVALPMYGVIVLYGVTELPEQSLKDLETFVAAGGGLWLIPSRDASPAQFDKAYGSLLDGFVLGPLKQPPEAQGLSRDEAQLANPLLAPMIRDAWGSVRDVFFTNYYASQAEGRAKVALRAENGDWLAAMAGGRGADAQGPRRGLVLMQLFTCDLDHSGLPRSSAFVPYVQQVLATLTDRGESNRPDVMRVGEALRLHLPEYRGSTKPVALGGPEKAELPLGGAESDEVRVADVVTAGAYTITQPEKSGRTRWVAVNPVSGESDVTPLTPEETEALFGKNTPALVGFAAIDDQFSRQWELTPWLLVLVFVAFAVEALYGAWQSRVGSRRDAQKALESGRAAA